MDTQWISNDFMGFLKEPAEVVFSEWTPWEMRRSIGYARSPGVYLIARFDDQKPSQGSAVHTDKHIVYIGLTGKRSLTSLASRWNAFRRSAFEGKFGHSGGRHYRESELPQTPEGLYVAAYAHHIPLAIMASGSEKVEVSAEWVAKMEEIAQAKRAAGKDPELETELNTSWRMYIERRCIFEYALANGGRLPVCNKE